MAQERRKWRQIINYFSPKDNSQRETDTTCLVYHALSGFTFFFVIVTSFSTCMLPKLLTRMEAHPGQNLTFQFLLYSLLWVNEFSFSPHAHQELNMLVKQEVNTPVLLRLCFKECIKKRIHEWISSSRWSSSYGSDTHKFHSVWLLKKSKWPNHKWPE